jgi:hypothetical protein
MRQYTKQKRSDKILESKMMNQSTRLIYKAKKHSFDSAEDSLLDSQADSRDFESVELCHQIGEESHNET